MEAISIRYTLSVDEFMQACHAHWSAHRQGSRSNTFLGLAAILAGIALLSFSFRMALAVCAAGLSLLLIIWTRGILWRNAYRGSSRFGEEIHIVFADESIRVEASDGCSDLKWRFYRGYLDSPRHLLLYTGKNAFSVIPKRAFSNSEEASRVMEMVDRNIPPRRSQ